MTSSRAFSCWIKHESPTLYLQLGVPFGTLLATCLTLLSKQIISMKASFRHSKPALQPRIVKDHEKLKEKA